MSKPSNCGDSKENKLEPRNTASGIPVKVVYTPEDIKDIDYTKELNDPGKYPFTRGLFFHPTRFLIESSSSLMQS